MTTPADELVLRLARERGLLREDQIVAAEAELSRRAPSSAPAPSVLELLVTHGIWRPQQSVDVLAAEFGMATIDLKGLAVPSEILSLIPANFAERHRLIPFAREGLILRVAVCDPLSTDGVDGLAHRLDLTIETFLASPEDINNSIAANYRSSHDALDTLLDGLTLRGEASSGEHRAPDQSAVADAPIIQLVHSIIIEGIQRRASDIHLEPLERRFRVRYRIDGVLTEVEGPPKRLQLAVISRLKIMANISIAQKRLPGDGRIQMVIGNRTLDLRVSSLPTIHGESIVMRILDKESLQLGLPELGFLSDDQACFERLITLPDGLLLVTGPTGSGKTTTLYGCLHHINKPDCKIITVEDPVEYQLTGINQVPVRHDVGMTFASALRAMLRQAPNIVMVGEIRDLETAEIAINASLTGHMVFSTLHTNDAPGAVTRLIDIGVKPFLVSTALRATMAQRLVRKICQKCRRPSAKNAAQLEALKLGAAISANAEFMEGAGCEVCNGTGFRGRIGIFEVFEVNEEIQRMIYENRRSTQLREKARACGMRTMREDGLRKATAGLTTVEEVVSITVGEAS